MWRIRRFLGYQPSGPAPEGAPCGGSAAKRQAASSCLSEGMPTETLEDIQRRFAQCKSDGLEVMDRLRTKGIDPHEPYAVPGWILVHVQEQLFRNEWRLHETGSLDEYRRSQFLRTLLTGHPRVVTEP